MKLGALIALCVIAVMAVVSAIAIIGSAAELERARERAEAGRQLAEIEDRIDEQCAALPESTRKEIESCS